MNEVKLSGIPSMSIGDIVDKLSESYCTIIKNALPLKTLPSVMLWGAPGIGKSQAIRQLAGEIELSTEKKVVVTDVRLLLFNICALLFKEVLYFKIEIRVWYADNDLPACLIITSILD